MGKYDDALPYLNTSLEINPNQKEIWTIKGFALTKLGRYKEAIESFNKAIEIDPGYEMAIHNKELALKESQT